MNDGVGLLLAGVAGLGLGLFHFAGLWWTVQRLPTSTNPALLTLVSLLVRTAGTLAGFYLVMDGRWQRLLACLAGFVLMRSILLYRWRPDRPDGERS